MIVTGMAAPDFILPSDDGTLIRLSDYAAQSVLLFFYPRDNTPGCTTEALGFSQNLAAFEAVNVAVFGISKDSLAKHRNFRNKYKLTVPLLSDADNTVCENYGTWKEKRMYGKIFMGIERTSVLIGKNGKILRIWPKVKVPGHVDEVLAAVRAL